MNIIVSTSHTEGIWYVFVAFWGFFLQLAIAGDENPEIKGVPITIVYNGAKNFWIKRRLMTTVWMQGNTTAKLEISTRCIVECISDAFTTDLMSCTRKLQSDFRSMFLKSQSGDISIVVDGKTLRVHKDVLSSRCSVFETMFSQEWREQTTQTVTIKDFNYKTILAMIEFIYFGGGDDDYEEDAADPEELLKAAHMYQLHQLKNMCEKRLCESVQKSNISGYMALADDYDLPNLKSAVFTFITNNKISH